MHEIARLNQAGVAYLAVGERDHAVKAFTAALGIMSKVTQEPSSMQIFQSTHHQISGSQAISGLDTSFYVYNNGLIFDASEDMDIVFSNSIILFNLALAFHQRGIMCGQEVKLRKALSMYDLCLQLIIELSPCSAALLLAALNNSAQIHFELADYQCASETLDALYGESAHVFLSECPPALLEQYHIDQFLLNVSLAKPPTTAACA